MDGAQEAAVLRTQVDKGHQEAMGAAAGCGAEGGRRREVGAGSADGGPDGEGADTSPALGPAPRPVAVGALGRAGVGSRAGMVRGLSRVLGPPWMLMPDPPSRAGAGLALGPVASEPPSLCHSHSHSHGHSHRRRQSAHRGHSASTPSAGGQLNNLESLETRAGFQLSSAASGSPDTRWAAVTMNFPAPRVTAAQPHAHSPSSRRALDGRAP